MKTEFTMTEEEMDRFKHINKTYMVFGGRPPESPQEQANDIWKDLALKYGFVWDSVEPSGSDQKTFLATKV